MRSIKFTEEELEFLKGQYELELIEAEKYITEIRNLLKKLGNVSAESPKTDKLSRKKGRGRRPKEESKENISMAAVESGEGKKKKGKRGRPKKRGPKKGSKRNPEKTLKASAPEAEVKLPAIKPIEKKAIAKQVLKSAVSGKAAKTKPAKAKKEIKKPTPKKTPKKQALKKETPLTVSPSVQVTEPDVTPAAEIK